MTERTKRKADAGGNAPAFEVRLNHIRCTVWSNTGDNGTTWFNTQITRRYRDGDEWKDSFSFSGLADLTLLAEACRLAKDFIASRELMGGDDAE